MKRVLCFFLLFLFALTAYAKDAPVTIQWPSEDNPVVRFTFGKFVRGGSVGSMTSYTVDVTAENLWDKKIPMAAFDAYFFNKEGVRIGNGYISLNNVGVGEKVRFTVQFSATGVQPVTMKLAATMVPKELGSAVPQKKIRLTVYSNPAGAKLKVDGVEAGETPKQVEFTLGKHVLQFSREGFHDGSFPVEFGPDDVSGGNVSYELGALAHDTVEMRDGSTLIADIESMDTSNVVVRLGGELKTLDRNQVKRILLAQREPLKAETHK